MPNMKSELESIAAKHFDMLIGIYFQNVGTTRLPIVPKGQTLGEFLVASKPFMSQFVLDWMKEDPKL